MLMKEGIQVLLHSISGKMPDDLSLLREKLAIYINELIVQDFSSLVQLLYQIDVDEQELKKILVQHQNTDAGILIADMLIRRELEKIESRKNFQSGKQEGDDDWP